MVLAHQGASHAAPPNTLPSFAMAVEQGADALELDVHWTRDGFIVVSHDETIDRCSDGHGPIREMTLAELRRFDFGYRFTADGGRTYPFRGRGVTIPTLREVLTTFPRMRVNIDIKPADPPSLARFVHEIHEAGAEDRVLVASFHHGVLERVRSMHRGLATSASPREAAVFCARTWLGRPPTRVPYVALQVPPRFWGISVLTPAVMHAAHAAGLKVHVWTIDDPAEMEAMWALGVDGIVTNEPGLAKVIRDRIGNIPSSVEEA
jgi:glycerophosphoryl diester phosphodiesterase